MLLMHGTICKKCTHWWNKLWLEPDINEANSKNDSAPNPNAKFADVLQPHLYVLNCKNVTIREVG